MVHFIPIYLEKYKNNLLLLSSSGVLAYSDFKNENCGDNRNFQLVEKANLLFTPVGFKLLGELIRIRTKNIDFNSPEAQKARREWGLSDDIGLGR